MRQTVEIYDENKKALKELSQKLNLSETKIINQAIQKFAQESILSEHDLEMVIAAFEKSSLGLQLRLNAREAAINSQVALEMLNSITYELPGKFFPTYTNPSNLYSQAKKRIEDKINARKASKKLL